jgi:hypothetical protein
MIRKLPGQAGGARVIYLSCPGFTPIPADALLA